MGGLHGRLLGNVVVVVLPCHGPVAISEATTLAIVRGEGTGMVPCSADPELDDEARPSYADVVQYFLESKIKENKRAPLLVSRSSSLIAMQWRIGLLEISQCQ